MATSTPDVEPVREHQAVALVEVRCDVLVIGGLLLGVRQQNHDHVRFGGRLSQGGDPQPCFFRLALAARSLAQGDPDIDARLEQVEGMGVPLRAVPQDRHLAAGDQAWVGVGLVVQRGHDVCSFLSFDALTFNSLRQDQ
jgi:hypothetical protein